MVGLGGGGNQFVKKKTQLNQALKIWYHRFTIHVHIYIYF